MYRVADALGNVAEGRRDLTLEASDSPGDADAQKTEQDEEEADQVDQKFRPDEKDNTEKYEPSAGYDQVQVEVSGVIANRVRSDHESIVPQLMMRDNVPSRAVDGAREYL